MISINDPVEGEYEMAWYTNKRGEGPRQRTVKKFKEKGKGPIKIGPENLVHVIPALNGKRVTEGTLPAAAVRAMAAVVRAGKDAVANGQCSCAACEEERDSAGYVTCDRCAFVFHVECANPEAEVGQDDWWCQRCLEIDSSAD